MLSIAAVTTIAAMILSAGAQAPGLMSEPTPEPRTVQATFAPYASGASAITYDKSLVPQGATVRLMITPQGTGEQIAVDVTGLEPDRGYGAHLHVKQCGPDGEDAGPHYQHTPDPAATEQTPSKDPAYANPNNEIWLDFTTDGQGAAKASTMHEWPFNPQDPPRSLVIHTEHTRTGPDSAGMAGARLACVNLW